MLNSKLFLIISVFIFLTIQSSIFCKKPPFLREHAEGFSKEFDILQQGLLDYSKLKKDDKDLFIQYFTSLNESEKPLAEFKKWMIKEIQKLSKNYSFQTDRTFSKLVKDKLPTPNIVYFKSKFPSIHPMDNNIVKVLFSKDEDEITIIGFARNSGSFIHYTHIFETKYHNCFPQHNLIQFVETTI